MRYRPKCCLYMLSGYLQRRQGKVHLHFSVTSSSIRSPSATKAYEEELLSSSWKKGEAINAVKPDTFLSLTISLFLKLFYGHEINDDVLRKFFINVYICTSDKIPLMYLNHVTPIPNASQKKYTYFLDILLYSTKRLDSIGNKPDKSQTKSTFYRVQWAQ